MYTMIPSLHVYLVHLTIGFVPITLQGCLPRLFSYSPNLWSPGVDLSS